MCCFVRPRAYCWLGQTIRNAQFDRSMKAFSILSNEKVMQIKLHVPGQLYMTEEEAAGIINDGEAMPRPANTRLAASYMNFYIANSEIIASQFGDKKWDDEAVRVLSQAFPDRDVVSIEGAREIAPGGGDIHCISLNNLLLRSS